MDDTTTPSNATLWGQWNWEDTGPGKHHAIAKTGMGITTGPAIALMPAVQLACGRVRPFPSSVRRDPPRDQCCVECLALDDLKGGLKVSADHDLTYQPKETVPA